MNIDPINKADKTEEVVNQQQEKKFLGVQRRPFKGARLYALDIEKLEVFEVHPSYNKRMVDYKNSGVLAEVDRAEYHINPNYYHVWALNDRNALKKFRKQKFEL